MTRYDKIKSMTIEEIAEKIIELNFTDEYCKNDCRGNSCKHELECCIRWLKEESKWTTQHHNYPAP